MYIYCIRFKNFQAPFKWCRIFPINSKFWMTLVAKHCTPTLGFNSLVTEPAKPRQSNQQSQLFQTMKHPNVPWVASHQGIWWVLHEIESAHEDRKPHQNDAPEQGMYHINICMGEFNFYVNAPIWGRYSISPIFLKGVEPLSTRW